jgi:hydrogenase 3 maturation protease
LKTARWVPEQATSTRAAWQQKLEATIASSATNLSVAVVGVGHPLRGDDYVGSYIAKTLTKQTNGIWGNDVHIFDAEANVEAIITRLADLSTEYVVFIDACGMGARAGEVRFLPVAETSYPFFTTHGIPLKLLAERLLPKSEVWVLAIQPGQTEFGDKLSPDVHEAADSISKFLTVILKKEAS